MLKKYSSLAESLAKMLRASTSVHSSFGLTFPDAIIVLYELSHS